MKAAETFRIGLIHNHMVIQKHPPYHQLTSANSYPHQTHIWTICQSVHELPCLPFVLDDLLEAIANGAVSVSTSGSDLKLKTSLDD
jgi:hypothetical protein